MFLRSRLDWNIVVGVRDDRFQNAVAVMRRFGPVERSKIVNVLMLKVDEPDSFVHRFAALIEKEPAVLDSIFAVVPAQYTFGFRREKDFADQVGNIITERWGSTLKQRKFQIRTRRRGYAREVPRKLDPGEKRSDIVDELGVWGAARPDCDYIITIETVRRRAGLSLWSSAEFTRYRFLDFG